MVTLFNASEQTDEVDEILAEGDFTAEGTWPSGQNMTRLLQLLDEGKTYVEVRTLTNPTGELRGTIEVLQKTGQDSDNNGGDNGD